MNEFVDADDEPRAELVAFLDAVVNEVRVLYPSLLQHNDVYGRVLPEVFVTELAEWVGDEFAGESPTPDALHFLAFLERSYPASSDAIRELIDRSFLDEFPPPVRRSLLVQLGPAMTASAKLIWA
jgi:hypothetical protein